MDQNRRRVVVVLGTVILLVIAAILTGGPEEDGTRLGEAGRREQDARPPGQAGPVGGATSVPVSLVLLLGLAGPAAAVGAILATNRREASRLEHERELKGAELEETRLTKVREERLQAYAELNGLAGTFDSNEYVMSDLKAAFSQIQLLTDNERVLRSAESLTGKINRTRKLVRDVKLANPEEDPADDPTVRSAIRETEAYRLSFIADAREDLGYSTTAL